MTTYLNLFKNIQIKNDSVLDLGCGPGHHSRVFLENGFKIKGIDLSTEMIAIAQKEVLDGDFEVMDILDLKLESESFDGIWASASLLHIPKNKIKSVLKVLKRLLVQDGVLYISLKQGNGSEVIKDNRYHGVDKYYVYYQPEEINELLISVGFKIIEKEQKERRSFYDTNPWIHIFSKKE